MAGAAAGDGVGNCARLSVAQAPVLVAAVVGVASATASDSGGSCVGHPVAQASVLAGVAPVPTHVAKAPALAAEVGATAPAHKWKTKRVMKVVATARVVSAPTPAEVVPTDAAAAPAPKWKTKTAKNAAVGTAAVAETAEVVSPSAPAEEVPAPAPTANAPAAPAPVAVLTAPVGHILNSILEVVESNGTFVDPNIVGSDVEVV